jgi:hypothetical protein
MRASTALLCSQLGWDRYLECCLRIAQDDDCGARLFPEIQGEAERLQSCGTNGAHARLKTRQLQDRPDSEQALSQHILKQCRGRQPGSRGATRFHSWPCCPP